MRQEVFDMFSSFFSDVTGITENPTNLILYHISVGSNMVQKALRLLSHRSHSNLGLKMINFKSELLTWIGSVSVPG